MNSSPTSFSFRYHTTPTRRPSTSGVNRPKRSFQEPESTVGGKPVKEVPVKPGGSNGLTAPFGRDSALEMPMNGTYNFFNGSASRSQPTVDGKGIPDSTPPASSGGEKRSARIRMRHGSSPKAMQSYASSASSMEVLTGYGKPEGNFSSVNTLYDRWEPQRAEPDTAESEDDGSANDNEVATDGSEEVAAPRNMNLYDVEKIIKKKRTNNRIRYLVKWLGFEELTWEPRSSFKDISSNEAWIAFKQEEANKRLQRGRNKRSLLPKKDLAEKPSEKAASASSAGRKSSADMSDTGASTSSHHNGLAEAEMLAKLDNDMLELASLPVLPIPKAQHEIIQTEIFMPRALPVPDTDTPAGKRAYNLTIKHATPTGRPKKVHIPQRMTLLQHKPSPIAPAPPNPKPSAPTTSNSKELYIVLPKDAPGFNSASTSSQSSRTTSQQMQRLMPLLGQGSSTRSLMSSAKSPTSVISVPRASVATSVGGSAVNSIVNIVQHSNGLSPTITLRAKASKSLRNCGSNTDKLLMDVKDIVRVAKAGKSGIDKSALIVGITGFKPRELAITCLADIAFYVTYANHAPEFIDYEECIRKIPHEVADFLSKNRIFALENPPQRFPA